MWHSNLHIFPQDFEESNNPGEKRLYKMMISWYRIGVKYTSVGAAPPFFLLPLRTHPCIFPVQNEAEGRTRTCTEGKDKCAMPDSYQPCDAPPPGRLAHTKPFLEILPPVERLWRIGLRRPKTSRMKELTFRLLFLSRIRHFLWGGKSESRNRECF